jgi:hypothetical protein
MRNLTKLIKQLQADLDFSAEKGSDTVAVDFDDLNSAITFLEEMEKTKENA